MQITIHRGIDQIGGCITEIRTARSKILIDLGHNLPKGNGRRKTGSTMPGSLHNCARDAMRYSTRTTTAITWIYSGMCRSGSINISGR